MVNSSAPSTSLRDRKCFLRVVLDPRCEVPLAADRIAFPSASLVTAVLTELPRGRIGQLHIEDRAETRAGLRRLHRNNDLDPTPEVSRTPIRRADGVELRTSVGEV